jgi:hypothetical protein
MIIHIYIYIHTHIYIYIYIYAVPYNFENEQFKSIFKAIWIKPKAKGKKEYKKI